MSQLNPKINNQLQTQLKDYSPATFLIEQAHLTIELDPNATIITAKLQLKKNQLVTNDCSSLHLDGENLELLEIKVNQQILSKESYSLTASKLIIFDAPPELTLETKVKINPAVNLSCLGLYLTNDIFCTQNEPEGFRKLTYFIDRPDVLTIFTTTIIADQKTYPVLLANGNLLHHQKLPKNQHSATWHDPYPKSSYLFALVAGKLDFIEDYHFTSITNRKITIRIYTKSEQLSQCHYALSFLKQAMLWEEKNFELEYDLDLYQVVVIDDFNFGAMENKGLNIFNSKLLLATPDTATDHDLKRIASVIAHEYFHNWTGNRVTCKNWFQLGLKEGLTTLREQLFMEDLYDRESSRIDSIKTLYEQQFPEDEGPLAHPIRPASYLEIDNFYTSTVYEKSAEVARMLITIFDRKTFQNIIKNFLTKYDGQAVTIDDFIKVASSITGKDLKQFKLWYDQSGPVELKIKEEFKAGAYTLSVEQLHPKAPSDFYLPLNVGLISTDDRTVTKTLLITSKSERFTFENFSQKPLPSILQGFSAPVKIDYNYSPKDWQKLIINDNDPINRWLASQGFMSYAILKTTDCLTLIAPIFDLILSDKKLPPALAALMLTVPSEKHLFNQATNLDIDEIHRRREALKLALASAFEQKLLIQYQQNHYHSPYTFNEIAIGQRSFKNVILSYLITLNHQAVFSLALAQLKQDNLTEVYSSLYELVNSRYPNQDELLNSYYYKWQNNHNLVNKWLTLNATIKDPGTANKIQKLLDHPAFNLKNPNKVYALICAFTECNLVNFHTVDGSGYQLLADQIIAIDNFNPQLAARLTTSFTKTKKLGETRIELVNKQLLKIKNKPNLSNNVDEVVTKILA